MQHAHNITKNIFENKKSFSKFLQGNHHLSKLNQNFILDKQNRVMKPKVLFADSVVQSKQSILIGEFAKLISNDGFKIGRNRLFAWLRENGFLHVKGVEYNQPLQRYKEQGLFETIERTILDGAGNIRLVITTKITGKGQIYFAEKFLLKCEV